ncbi:hypothetical protein [Glycomyces buryatensis]|uniref:Peptidase M23 n=1 Tax=Glycomyces buryatensis TaxID=2570927 RepID=A0A4S8QI13_9ACTN|nr:hypothetical protein [Glycomyces buryatensis]THV42625.1 hypothetical protein FAB82_05510 [Glycomyces buryatensis]
MLSKIIEGATGTVRNAASAVATRLNGVRVAAVERLSGEHRGRRRIAVIALAAAVFVGSGATAAWALTTNEETYGEPEAVAVDATTEEATEEATTEAPTEEVTEEATEEAPAEPAPEETTEEETTEAPDPGPVDIDVSDLDDEQEANAVTIIETGAELGFDDQGWAVALATAMQEAKMYNAASEAVPESFEYSDSSVSYSDHDSVGIFQQRPSMGWGSVEELMDVSTSASKFYNTLSDVSGWESMSIASAAQAVQISAYPDYYAQWEGLAWDVIDAYNAAK